MNPNVTRTCIRASTPTHANDPSSTAHFIEPVLNRPTALYFHTLNERVGELMRTTSQESKKSSSIVNVKDEFFGIRLLL